MSSHKVNFLLVNETKIALKLISQFLFLMGKENIIVLTILSLLDIQFSNGYFISHLLIKYDLMVMNGKT